MLPLSHVLHQTNRAFRQAPWLAAPFLVSSIALRLVTATAGASEPLLLTGAMLLHLALTAGFMGAAYHLANRRDEAPGGSGVPESGTLSRETAAEEGETEPASPGEAFLIGVGRHFTGLAVGHGLLLLGALLVVGGTIRGLSTRFPLPNESLLTAMRERLKANQLPLPEQLEVMLPWAWAMVALALLFLVAMLLLSGWKQILVAEQTGTFDAFRQSARFVLARFGTVVAILGIEGVADTLLLPLLFVAEPFFRALADVGIVTMHAWASLALMMAWLHRPRG
ncbi:MAG: hypothetical protein VKP57_03150 [Candidatus Sericytochromatia bacterium]|nr:hypothetical protein [Candidatus Sericytochromatia bacterium]